MNKLNLTNESIYYKPYKDKLDIVNKLKMLGYKFNSSSCFLNHNSLVFSKKEDCFRVGYNDTIINEAKPTEWWLNRINDYLMRDNSNSNNNTILDKQIEKLIKDKL